MAKSSKNFPAEINFNMEKKKFKKYERAMLIDLQNYLSKVEKYSPYSYGFFMGALEIQQIWLKIDDEQFRKLGNHVKETFSPKNFNWLGNKRKLNASSKSTK